MANLLEVSRRRLDDEHLAIARKRCKSTPRTSFDRVVYFVAADDGPIKIGMACDVKRRLRELRTKTKMDLKVLATVGGSSFREGAYHQRFACHRTQGEWFSRHPEILAEIERLNSTPTDAGRQGQGSHQYAWRCDHG
ncbi:MAG: GIY-YIG nuclease family protein [Sphingobium sp.]